MFFSLKPRDLKYEGDDEGVHADHLHIIFNVVNTIIGNLMKLSDDEASEELEDKSEAEGWEATQGETPVDDDGVDNDDDDTFDADDCILHR